jgi:hypothetical protein
MNQWTSLALLSFAVLVIVASTSMGGHTGRPASATRAAATDELPPAPAATPTPSYRHSAKGDAGDAGATSHAVPAHHLDDDARGAPIATGDACAAVQSEARAVAAPTGLLDLGSGNQTILRPRRKPMRKGAKPVKQIVNAVSHDAAAFLRRPRHLQPMEEVGFLLQPPTAAAAAAGCCSIGASCSGEWTAQPNCSWSALRHRAADFATARVDSALAAEQRLPPGSCMRHASVAAAAFDSAWLDKLVNDDRRVLGLVGHSHQRNLMRLLEPMLAAVYRGRTAYARNESGGDTIADAATGRVLALYDETYHGEVNFGGLAAAGVTDVLIGRGMWDMNVYDTAPDDVRVQTQVALAELRRRLPRAQITVYATHFGHAPHADGCFSLERQLLYREALYAAVHNVNAFVLPAPAFRAAAGLGGADAAALAHFTDPVRVLDVFAMTATPEARRCSDLRLRLGHHYGTPVLLNILARWLTSPNTAPAPPAPTPDADIDTAVWRPRQRAPRQRAPRVAGAAAAYFSAAIVAKGFHRYSVGVAARAMPVCNHCRTYPAFYDQRAAGAAEPFAVPEPKGSGCAAVQRRLRASCGDPVAYVLFESLLGGGDYDDVIDFLDDASVHCVDSAMKSSRISR